MEEQTQEHLLSVCTFVLKLHLDSQKKLTLTGFCKLAGITDVMRILVNWELDKYVMGYEQASKGYTFGAMLAAGNVTKEQVYLSIRYLSANDNPSKEILRLRQIFLSEDIFYRVWDAATAG